MCIRDSNGQFVHDEVALVPHRLADAGYRTGGFVSAVVLDGTYGLERGFEHYEDGFDLTTPGRPGDPILQWSADHVVDSALAWLGRQPSEDPVFLWVHFYDPHLPLRPPQAFASAFDDPYAAEIAFADSQLDRLLQRVEARGRPVAGICLLYTSPSPRDKRQCRMPSSA